MTYQPISDKYVVQWFDNNNPRPTTYLKTYAASSQFDRM